MRHFSNKRKDCERCGTEFLCKNRKKRFCDSCRAELRTIQTREAMKRYQARNGKKKAEPIVRAIPIAETKTIKCPHCDARLMVVIG